jgi:hypothetical protein
MVEAMAGNDPALIENGPVYISHLQLMWLHSYVRSRNALRVSLHERRLWLEEIADKRKPEWLTRWQRERRG